jgi:hypothetical protein
MTTNLVDSNKNKVAILIVQLFSNSDNELDEGQMTTQRFRQLVKERLARLRKAETMVKTLTQAGWKGVMLPDRVVLDHPDIHSEAQAREHLFELGIDPAEVDIGETVRGKEQPVRPGRRQREVKN